MRYIRPLISLLVAAGLVVLAVVLLSSSTHTHDVSVEVPDATGLLSGDYIRDAGVTIGQIGSIQAIDGGSRARIQLDIDDKVWPLPQGTKFNVRWGGTINEYDRYITMTKGNGGGSEVADGGTLPTADFSTPVEYGSLLNDFTPATRQGIKTLLNNGGSAISTAKSSLKGAMKSAPPVLNQANHVLEDLNSNETDLKDLLTTAGSVVNAVDTSDPGLSDLLQGASGTFTAIASEDNNLKQTLSGAPATLQNVKTTLAKANPTLVSVNTLAHNIAPGVNRLKAIAQPLDRLLGTVDKVGPSADATLSTAVSAAPQVTKLVDKVVQLAPTITSISTQANTALSCIRPYTPEIAAFGSNWGSALSSNVDNEVYVRADPSVIIPAPENAEAQTPSELTKAFPGIVYDFPRAPGSAADEPWYQPQCGITADGLNSADDPETDPNYKVP